MRFEWDIFAEVCKFNELMKGDRLWKTLLKHHNGGTYLWKSAKVSMYFGAVVDLHLEQCIGFFRVTSTIERFLLIGNWCWEYCVFHFAHWVESVSWKRGKQGETIPQTWELCQSIVERKETGLSFLLCRLSQNRLVVQSWLPTVPIYGRHEVSRIGTN